MKQRMLGFVAACEVPGRPGIFAFWPEAARPDWARAIPADADDTALCLSALYRAGRLSRAQALRHLARNLLPNRIQRADPFSPAWIGAGAFKTWLVADAAAPNQLDCAVNANILALMAELGMRDTPGRDAAIRMIGNGLDWAGYDPLRLRTLTPFYPDLREFALALENAVAAGCSELRAPLNALRRFAPGLPGPEAVLCSAAYGRDGWRCPALHKLRAARADILSQTKLYEATAP